MLANHEDGKTFEESERHLMVAAKIGNEDRPKDQVQGIIHSLQGIGYAILAVFQKTNLQREFGDFPVKVYLKNDKFVTGKILRSSQEGIIVEVALPSDLCEILKDTKLSDHGKAFIPRDSINLIIGLSD